MLDNKQNILTFLIEHRLFAPSVSAFATLLGYVNRTKIYRQLIIKSEKLKPLTKYRMILVSYLEYLKNSLLR